MFALPASSQSGGALCRPHRSGRPMSAAALALLHRILGGDLNECAAQDLRPDQQRFRTLYKELVETNTSLSVGDCTLAAQKMAVRAAELVCEITGWVEQARLTVSGTEATSNAEPRLASSARISGAGLAFTA